MFLVVLTGHFSGLGRPVPLGPTAPPGSVLTMRIAADSATGAYPVPGTTNIADAPPGLSAVGMLTPLALPRTPALPAPDPGMCAGWTGRAIAGNRAMNLTRKRAGAAADRLTRSRLGFLVLLRRLCTRPSWRAVSFTLQEQAGPSGASSSLTIANGQQATALAALLPVLLPPSVADPTCVVRSLSPHMRRATLRLLSITLSDGRNRLVQSYPTCNLPAPLEPVRAAWGHIADPCECAHGG